VATPGGLEPPAFSLEIPLATGLCGQTRATLVRAQGCPRCLPDHVTAETEGQIKKGSAVSQDKILNFAPKFQLKEDFDNRASQTGDRLRTLARAIREMRERGVSSNNVARLLRQAADDLDKSDSPA